MTKLQRFVLFGGLSILFFKLSNIYWTFYVPAVVLGAYSWYEFFGLFKVSRDEKDTPIRFRIFPPNKTSEDSYRERVVEIAHRTLSQFAVDPASDSKYTQFDILQRNMVMRLRHAAVPGDFLLQWTLWDGKVIEYQLKEEII